jgi:hypothetical protein
MAGGLGRALPVISSTDLFVLLPAAINGDPARGVKSVGAFVNNGSLPAMDAESNPGA